MKLQNMKIKVGIMAASTLQMAAVALMGLVPLAIVHYYDQSVTSVQSAFTLPMLTIAPAMLTVGFISKYIGKKIPLIVGLTLIFIFSIIPAVFELPFPLFMLMTGGFGLGVGCVMSSAAGLITDYFTGAERANLMGKQSAFINLGGMLLAFAVGVLLPFGWTTALFVYIYTIPILLIVLLCIPGDRKASGNKQGETGKRKLTSGTLFICVIFLFFGVFQGATLPNAGLLVQERNLGDPATASFGISMMTAVGIIAGLLYGRITLIIKKYMLPSSLVVMAGGILLAGSATTVLQFYVGFIVLGFGHASAIPTGTFLAAQSVDQASSTLAMSVFYATLCAAIFFSPMITNPLSEAIAAGTAQNRYFIGATVLIALAVVSLINAARKKEELGRP